MDGRSSSLIRLFTASTMAEAASLAASCIEPEPPQDAAPVILPSSLARDDALVRALRRSLRSRRISLSVVVPEHPLRVATRAITGGGAAWRSLVLALPDGGTDEVLLPTRIAAADSLVYVTLVDTVARRGPFQLDLLSRYVHPCHRWKRVLDPDRAGRAAEVNLWRRPDWCVVGCDAPVGVVGVTRDVVAGELLALSLAERFFDRQTEFASPWEDRVVQRATELELGVRIPGEIELELITDPTVAEQARKVVDVLHQRMGVVLSDRA